MKSFYASIPFLIMIVVHTVSSQESRTLGLDDALAIARRCNPEMRMRLYDIERERGRLLREVSPSSPALTVDYDFVPSGSTIQEYDERSIRLSQSIEFPVTSVLRGRYLASGIEMREAERRAASAVLEAGVKRAYYRALARQNRIQLATENLALSDEFARKAEIRYDVGEGTHLERVTAKAQRTQALIELQDAQSAFTNALNDLLLRIGDTVLSTGSRVRLTDSLMYIEYPESLEALLDRAWGGHPLLNATSLGVATANAHRALAWSELLPRLEFGYAFQSRGGISDYYGISFGLSLPLWFAFEQRGKLRETSAEVARAEVEHSSMRMSITLAVRSAYDRRVKAERELLLYTNDLEPDSREILRIATASYNAGEVGYLEFLQAKQTVITVRNGYMDALAEYHIAQADLEEAIGLYHDEQQEQEETR